MAERKSKELIYSIIKRYVDELRKRKIEVIGVYLFGSYAKGKVDKWSDIDIAVITRKFIGDNFDFKFILMKIAREIDADLEPHPFMIDEFTEDNLLVSEIIKTGERVI